MMSNEKTLQEAVKTAAAVVSDWQRSIASIETQFNVANLALMKSQKERETHALKASMGDVAAIAAVKHARDAQRDAQSTIDDLKIALPEAQAQLAAAEKAAESARRALAQFEVIVLQRKRVDIAGELDEVSRNFERLYKIYDELGREIVNMPDAMPKSLHGMSDVEGAVGARRVRASLPAFFWKLFPGAVHDEMRTEPLATTEARFWNLPPDHDEKSKAA
jgi:hypothetical protein